MGPVRPLGFPMPLGKSWLTLSDDYAEQLRMFQPGTDEPGQQSLGGAEEEQLRQDESRLVLLSTIIIPGENTAEGLVVEAVAIVWLELLKALKADPGLAFRIDPFKWEEIMAAAYKSAGFDRVIRTPRSGDFGRDWIAERHGDDAVRVLGQMKRYSPHRKVGANEVREMLHVVTDDRNASKGVLVTTSDFASGVRCDPAIEPYLPYRLELVNGEALIQKLETLADRSNGASSLA